MRFAKPRLFVRNATTFTVVNASPSTTTVSSAPFASAKWLRERSRRAPAFVLLFALCKPSSGSRSPVPFSISLGELCSPSTAPCTKEPSGAADGTGNELRFRDGSHGRNVQPVNARHSTERGALEILEEAFHLIRMAPLSLLLTYYLGAIPFVLGLLFFWSDMSRGTFADDRLAIETIGLTLLFVWMKTWQALFARQLTGQIMRRPLEKLTAKKIASGVLAQAILQPSGLFLIPVALLLLFPIAWVYGFYQNVTALGGFDNSGGLFRKSVRYSAIWPRQSNYIVFLFKAFGFFVFLNVFIGVVAVPYLLATLLGIDSIFVQSPWTIFNTTFFAGMCAVTYLCVDPVVKAAYTVRCFYGDSRETGEDLRSELRSYAPALQKAAAIVALAGSLLFAPTQLSAAESAKPAEGSAMPVRPNELNTSIEQVLKRPEYTWRLPREKRLDKKEKGAIASFFDSAMETVVGWGRKVKDWMEKFSKWFRPRNSYNPSSGSRLGLDWLFGVQGLIFLL